MCRWSVVIHVHHLCVCVSGGGVFRPPVSITFLFASKNRANPRIMGNDARGRDFSPHLFKDVRRREYIVHYHSLLLLLPPVHCCCTSRPMDYCQPGEAIRTPKPVVIEIHTGHTVSTVVPDNGCGCVPADGSANVQSVRCSECTLRCLPLGRR